MKKFFDLIIFLLFFFKTIFFKLINYKIIFIDCSRIGGYYDLIWSKRSNVDQKIFFVYFSLNMKIANLYFHKILSEDFDIQYNRYNFIIYKFFSRLKLNSNLLNIVPDNYKIYKKIYSNKNHSDYYQIQKKLIANYNFKYKKNIYFQNSDNILKKFNLKKNMFITFHARDNKYLKTIYPLRDWSYHDYRDSNISNYSSAIYDIHSTYKFQGVRIGKFTNSKLENTKAILDYANHHEYSDEGEILLVYNSKLLVCSDSGASIFAEYINKPIVYANWSNPLRISRWHSKGLFIFKKVFSKDKLRYLSFNDLFNFNFEDKYFKQKYEIHENSPSEIRSAIEEQIQRLDQSWVDTQENIYLQNRFWSLFGDYDYSRDSIFIGSSFLANNQYLIE